MGSTNIQIAVKVRPLIERELKEKVEPLWLVKENSIVNIDNARNFLGEPYSFDHIFDQNTDNKEVYDAVVKPLVLSCLEGINSTIFAYGQTSSGKTHTMLGDKNVPGIIMYTVQDIFKHIEETDTKNFLLRCSYLEIYNEKINDLLDTKAKDLKIREDYDQMVYVHSREEVIRDSSELFLIMKKGMKTRKIGCTDMNERSSRSHTIFKLVIQSQNKDSEGSYTESSLSLVDLAGSERVGQMNLKAERQVEGVSINKSLTTLGLVIRKLSENEQFINYRDSKLTRLLQHSLGGNSKTLIICTVTVAAIEETKSTLEFAQRAKYVKNRPIINERVTDKDQLKQYAHLCQDYKGQIEKLRLEKLEREKTINALEDKISNIQLFTSGNFEKNLQVSKIPQRRHTLGYYKPIMAKSLIPMITLDSEGSGESSEEEPDKHDPPVKSEVLFTSEDDKENVNFGTDTIATTPTKTTSVFKTPKIPKTPSPILRIQKGLLEESYESLKVFTNHEKQLLDHHDEIKELKELTERLRNENIELRQQNMKENQLYSKIVERNKEVFDQLVLLQSILEGKPVEEVRRKSLHTITEEDFEMICDQIDPTASIQILDQSTKEVKKFEEINEENRLLKQQLKGKENVISNLSASWAKEKDELEAHCMAMVKENNQLKSEIDIKNIKIGELEACISQHKDIKEAELQILTNKIKQLNDYKEEMHKQLSEIQQSKQELSKDKFDEENKRLKSELEDVIFQLTGEQKEVENMSQQLDEKSLKITDLEKEILHLKQQNSNLQIKMEQSQEFLKTIDTLGEDNNKKEQEIRTLEEKFRFLDQEYTETKNQLQVHRRKLCDKDEEINKLVADRNLQTTELDLLKSKILELQTQVEEFSREKKCSYNFQQELEHKIENLVKENDDCRTELKQLVAKSLIITGLEKEILHLKQQNNDLQIKTEQSQEFLKTVDTLGEDINKKEQEIKTLEEKFRFLDQEYTETKNQLQEYSLKLCEKSEEINKLVADKNLQTTELDLLKSKILELQTQVEEFSQEKKCSYNTQQEIEHKTGNLVKENDDCRMELKHLDEKSLIIIDLEKEILHLKQQNNDLQIKAEQSQEFLKTIDTSGEEINRKEQEIKILEEKFRFLDQEYNETKNQLQEHSLKLCEKSEEINKLVADKNLQTTELDLLKSKILELQTQVEQFSRGKKCSCNFQQELEHKIGNLVKENDDCRTELEQLDEKSLIITGLEKEILHLKQQNNDLQIKTDQSEEFLKTIDTLGEDSNKKEQEIKTEEKFRFLDQEYNETKNQLQEHSLKLCEKSEEINKLVTDKNPQTTELNLLKSKILELQAQVEEFSRKKKCSYNSQQELEHKIGNLVKENDDCRTELEQFDKKSLIITGLEKEILHLRQQNNDLQIKTDQSQEFLKTIDTLGEDCNTKEQEIKTVEEKFIFLDQEYNETKNQLQEHSLKLCEKSEEINKLVADKNLQTIELNLLKSKILELQAQGEEFSREKKSSYNFQQELEHKIGNLVKENGDCRTELEQKNTDLVKVNDKLKEKLRYIINLEQSLANHVEKIQTLKDICLTLERQLSDDKKQLNSVLEELDKANDSYNNLKAKYSAQDLELGSCKEELNDKIAELEEKSQLYNNILTNYAAKNVEIESLEIENEDLKNKLDELYQKQKETSDLQELLKQRDSDIDKLTSDNLELKQRLDSNVSLQDDLDKYILDIAVVKEQRNAVQIQLNDLKSQLNKITFELDEKSVENNRLIKDNTELKDHLNTLSKKQLAFEAMQEEIERQKDEKTHLIQQIDELVKDNIDINIQLTKLTSDLNTKQQEIKRLKETSERQTEEMKAVKKDKAKLTEKMEVALMDLLDMKRHLDKRNEEISHLKGKYNALEVQLSDCKDSLKAKIQELDRYTKKTDESEILSLKSQFKNVTLDLNQAQKEYKLKTGELKSAFEEIQSLKQNISNYEGNIILLKSTISKLTDEKVVLEKKLSKSDDRVKSLEEMLSTENQSSEIMNHLKKELHMCKDHVKALELEIEKLRLSESEVENLQAKLNDLVQYKKRMQDKISDGTLKEVPLPRLSDEGRPLSPNELRKIKRQSIHDQRRGLVFESSDSLELADTECPDCQELRNKFKRILEKNKHLLGDMEDMRKNYDYLKAENEYISEKNREMDLKIKELEKNDYNTCDKILSCSGCKELRSKLGKVEEHNKKLRIDIEDLKRENAFLDRENEDMLKIIKEMEQSENDIHKQLQDCKKLIGSSADEKLRVLQIKYDDIVNQKLELEKELAQNKKAIIKYKNAIADVESTYLKTEYKQASVIKELRRELDDCRSKPRKMPPSMEDKETQATCDLHEKYKTAKQLAQIRRQEGNYLRAKLHLPPDCAVLPEDIQRQPTNV